MLAQTAATPRLLVAKNVSGGTPEGKTLFRDISFELGAGEILILTGPNGAGKSTLLRTLLGHASAAAGNIYRSPAATRVGYVPQMQNMEFHLPVTLREVIEISKDAPVTDTQIEAQGLLRADDLNRGWNTASGGERQRTLLTCALLDDPNLLFLDEPFNHLDGQSQHTMVQAIKKFLTAHDMRAVVLVSHLGIDELAQLGRVIRLELGR